MKKYEDLLTSLDNGNLSAYQEAIRRMSSAGIAHYTYWLHFIAADHFNGVLITRAFLHNKLTFEANNIGHRSEKKHSTVSY